MSFEAFSRGHLVLVGFIAILSACGGGSSSSSGSGSGSGSGNSNSNDSSSISNDAPIVSNLNIAGANGADTALGDTLRIEYDYSDVDGDIEGDSKIRWLRNDEPIEGADERSYALVENDSEQIIRAEVTPEALTGNNSAQVFSALITLEKLVFVGQFIDTARQGLRYVTSTRSGLTDSEGSFQYLNGETVFLYLGDLSLGATVGKPHISLFDLVEGAEPTAGNALRKSLAESVEFNSVINKATLLQTLDHDGNPENGIEIHAEVASLFEEDSIDFDQFWAEFRDDINFRIKLAEAKSTGSVSNDRQMRKSWQVMEHLYSSLGVDPLLKLNIRVSDDTDPENDLERHEYDSEGKITHSEVDDFYSTYIKYDTNGNPTYQEIDIIYADATITYTAEYDINGNPIRIEMATDSLVYRINIYEYDAIGQKTTWIIDNDGDGTMDQINGYEYNAKGNLIYQLMDNNADGAYDSSASFEYDSRGLILLIEVDTDLDGSPDQFLKYEHDEYDNLIREEYDLDGNGEADTLQLFTYEYDKNGNQTLKAHDYDGDGNTDRIYRFEYDDQSNLTLTSSDYDGDGSAESIYRFEYDDKGNQTLEVYDSSADGEPDRITASEYDSNGNLVKLEFDTEGDGELNSVLIYKYDAGDNLTAIQEDEDGDEIIDQTKTYEHLIDGSIWWSLLRKYSADEFTNTWFFL